MMYRLCSSRELYFPCTKNKPQGCDVGKAVELVSPGGAFENTPLYQRHGNANLMFCDAVWRLISRFPSPRPLKRVLLCRSYRLVEDQWLHINTSRDGYAILLPRSSNAVGMKSLRSGRQLMLCFKDICVYVSPADVNACS
jgi:hypothetical protein